MKQELELSQEKVTSLSTQLSVNVRPSCISDRQLYFLCSVGLSPVLYKGLHIPSSSASHCLVAVV